MVLIIALAGAFLFGLWKLYELRFTAGDIYPQYSSLRADPLGTKALYESLQQIPDISTARNYREIESLPKGKSTVLFLGENPFLFELMPEDEIKEYEALAASGARVVIAMRPVNRQREEPLDKKPPNQKPDDKKPHEAPVFEKRWGIHFGYITRPATQAEEEPGTNPKLTALYFRVDNKVLHRVERPFGTGAIVLLASCYPMSNEAPGDFRRASSGADRKRRRCHPRAQIPSGRIGRNASRSARTLHLEKLHQPSSSADGI